MRILLWFTIGFGLSCAAAAYDLMYPWLPPAALIAAALTAGVMVLKNRRKLLRPLLLFAAGCLAGTAWFSGFYMLRLQPLKTLDGEEVHLAITAEDCSYETPYGIGLEGSIELEDNRYPVRAYINEPLSLEPGDRAEGIFRIRLTVPDSREDSTYYSGQGIYLFAYQKGTVEITEAQSQSLRHFPAVLRHRILNTLASVFPEEEAAFAKALLLGDTRELDYATDTAFKLSGIRHIVAVSGLHISILFSLVCVVTLRRRYLTAAVGIPVLLLFAAVAGFTPSVNRACIMMSLMILSMVFDREYDAATALAFSVLVMLIYNPMAVTSVSLQLSVGCVAGILLFNGPIHNWLKEKLPGKNKLCSGFRSSVSVTLSSMTLVTPLSAAYFGTVSLVSVLTNLLTLWVVNLIFNGLAALCLLYPLSAALAGLLAKLLIVPIRYVTGTAKLLAVFPMAAVYTESVYIVLWIAAVYVLLAVFLLQKRKRPGLLLCCMVLLLCMALMASWTEPLTDDARVTMLDVGQGQAILLQSEGKTLLVDCGGDSDTRTADIVAQTLLSQGITKLDGIILTHYDRDHSGGLHNLLTRIDTDYLFLPDTQNEFIPPETAGEIIYVWEDLQLSYGETQITIFGPVYSGADNENSLCVLFDTEKCDILITGDRSGFGERMLLHRTQLPDVDILVAGHHGAADATTEKLLRAVTPETVLISAAKDNIYGHPAPALLQRLEQFGCTVCRTDLNGTIIIRR